MCTKGHKINMPQETAPAEEIEEDSGEDNPLPLDSMKIIKLQATIYLNRNLTFTC